MGGAGDTYLLVILAAFLSLQAALVLEHFLWQKKSLVATVVMKTVWHIVSQEVMIFQNSVPVTDEN